MTRDYLDPKDLNNLQDITPDVEDDIPEDDPYRHGKDFNRQWGQLDERRRKEDGDYTRSDGY